MTSALSGDVRIAVRVDAGDAVRALGAVEGAQKRAADATQQHAEAAQRGGVEVGKFGSALGLVGGVVGRFSGEVGGLIGRVGQATGVIQSMTTMGLGPLGLALGGLSVALQAGVSIWQEYENNVRSAARSVRDTAIPTFEQALDLIQRLDRERARQQRMEMGAGSEQEYRAQFDAAARRVAELRTQLRFHAGNDTPSGVYVADDEGQARERRRLMDLLRQAQAEADRARAQLVESRRIEAQIARDDAENAIEEIRAAAEQRDRPRRGGGGGRARREEQRDPKDEARALAAEAEALRQKREESMRLLMELGEQELDETMRALAEENAARMRALEERDRMEETARRARLEKEREEQERIAELREQGAQRLGAIASSIGASFESALGSSLDAVMTGAKTADEAFQQMLAAFARQVVGEATIGALKETALGFAALATYRAAEATNHFTAAGIWAAAGVAAAGVGGAAGAFSPPATPSGGGASGPPAPGRIEGRGGEQMIVVNFGGPVVTAGTEAELGRRIRDLVTTGAERLPR